jgi:hypothetical protein
MATPQFKPHGPNSVIKKKSKRPRSSSTFDNGSHSGTLLCSDLRFIDLTEVVNDDDFPDIYELLGESAPGDLDDRPLLDPLSVGQADLPANGCREVTSTKGQ